LPLLCGVVGYFVALAAFYTLRTIQEGQGRITAPKAQFVPWVNGNGKTQENGVAPGTTVQFSGAADFQDDLSVLWNLRPKSDQVGVTPPPAGTLSATGVLMAPNAAWIASNTREFLRLGCCRYEHSRSVHLCRVRSCISSQEFWPLDHSFAFDMPALGKPYPALPCFLRHDVLL